MAIPGVFFGPLIIFSTSENQENPFSHARSIFLLEM